MPVVLYFGTLCHHEAETAEDGYNLVAYKRQRVTCAKLHGSSRTGEVNLIGRVVGHFSGLLQGVDLVGGKSLELVDGHADGFLLVGRHVAEIGHQGVEFALFAEIFEAEGLHFIGVRSRCGFNLSLQCVYSVEHICSGCFFVAAKIRKFSKIP